ncbi:hypothetical protein BX600DRAFT_176495 [Xylariales sp. PMI_506]|nr:hypothetical protein BX600DRAFT_176495 [Xylariales sp. PMI_506]
MARVPTVICGATWRNLPGLTFVPYYRELYTPSTPHPPPYSTKPNAHACVVNPHVELSIRPPFDVVAAEESWFVFDPFALIFCALGLHFLFSFVLSVKVTAKKACSQRGLHPALAVRNPPSSVIWGDKSSALRALQHRLTQHVPLGGGVSEFVLPYMS